jgi:hypothetical protein
MEHLLVDSRLKYYNKSLKDQINNLELEIYSLEGADLYGNRVFGERALIQEFGKTKKCKQPE